LSVQSQNVGYLNIQRRIIVLYTLFFIHTALAERTWDQSIEHVSSAVVSIHMYSPRSFDTERPSAGQATGFIIDAEKGLILTNRHVVEPGPNVARALLQNSEEIKLTPIYRDPVHDFGLFQYDPSSIKHMDVTSLELCSSCAQVGLDVRLIGNDGGEKLSILEATLARLDRNSPKYGRGGYNDFNTFYYQASAGSSGGSSGSPVFNQNGQVVALNAGGSTRTASSFFLPLQRVERAVELIRQGKDVSRGTLLATLENQTYDELVRLGLSEDKEILFRNKYPQAEGALIFKHVLPKGPLDGKVRVGDVLISINNVVSNQFAEIEAIWDDNVGKEIEIVVDRQGESIAHKISVADLHEATPDEYADICGGGFHDLSYQIARQYQLPLQGVYVSNPGYCFDQGLLRRKQVITEVNGQPTPDLDTFWKIMKTIQSGEKMVLRAFSLTQTSVQRTYVVEWDAKWFLNQRNKRNDESGIWESIDTLQSEEKSLEPVSAKFAKKTRLWQRPRAKSAVLIENHVPYEIEGKLGDSYLGMGVVIDDEKGIVVTERDTVPTYLGDVKLNLFGDQKIPANILWVHPQKSLVFLKYDPDLVTDTPLKAARFSRKKKKPFFLSKVVAYDSKRRYQHSLALSGGQEQLFVPELDVPHFRQINLDVWDLNGGFKSSGGIVYSRFGHFRGLRATFPYYSDKEWKTKKYVIPSHIVQQAMEEMNGEIPLYSIGAELRAVSPYDARRFGLKKEFLNGEKMPKFFFYVRIIHPKSPAAKVLQTDDIILLVDGKAPKTYDDIEGTLREKSQATLQILRQGKVEEIVLEPQELSTEGIRQVLFVGGALLHDVHYDVPMQKSIDASGVYISWCFWGAPCSADKMSPSRIITEVDGQEVTNLAEFITILQKKETTSEPIPLRMRDFNGRPSVISLRLDELYWPTQLLEKTDEAWTQTIIFEESEKP
jgi:pro-apoptotic serine protease NMA111